MADSFTNNLNLVLQVTGSNSGTWGTELNNELITALDNVLGGVISITMSGSNVTLSLSQWQSKLFYIVGTLTANVTLVLPLSPNAVGGTPGVAGDFIVGNATTGNFAIGLKTAAASSGVLAYAPQGVFTHFVSDGLNVVWANSALSKQVGEVTDFAGFSAPAGHLLCAGQRVSTTRYPLLFDQLGYYYGGSGGVFGIPDYRGCVLAGQDNMGGAARGVLPTVVTDFGTITGTVTGSFGGSPTHTQSGDEVGEHNHSVNDPTHSHGAPGGSFWVTGPGQFAAGTGEPAANTDTALAATGITIQQNPAPAAMAWLQPTVVTNKIIFTGS